MKKKKKKNGTSIISTHALPIDWPNGPEPTFEEKKN